VAKQYSPKNIRFQLSVEREVLSTDYIWKTICDMEGCQTSNIYKNRFVVPEFPCEHVIWDKPINYPVLQDLVELDLNMQPQYRPIKNSWKFCDKKLPKQIEIPLSKLLTTDNEVDVPSKNHSSNGRFIFISKIVDEMSLYYNNLTKKTELYVLVATDLAQKELELNTSYKTNP
jgi:hypothetical protein